MDRQPPVDLPLGTGGNLPSPVSLAALKKILQGYDATIVNYLLHGFTSGFSVGCIGLPPQLSNVGVSNLKSTDEFPGVIDRKLAKELGLGRVLGPFEVP
ncbi:MAG: hypothetical protein M3H12_19965, partial [Chromatiales bacterium]